MENICEICEKKCESYENLIVTDKYFHVSCIDVKMEPSKLYFLIHGLRGATLDTLKKTNNK